jgi:cyclophilin family peptidyl-prolyl cis-trans isomerase
MNRFSIFAWKILPVWTLCLAGLVRAAASVEPSNLRVTPLGVNSFQLAWNDNSNNETGWEIRIALKGTAPLRFMLVPTPNLTSYLVTTNDLPGKDLVFQMKAYNGSAGKEVFSKPTSIVTVRALSPSRFDAPSELVATAMDESQIRLKWKDNSTSEYGYLLQYKSGTSTEWKSLGSVNPGITFKLPVGGLKLDTLYSFRVQAFRRLPDKTTAFSNVAQARTYPFRAPSGLVVTPESDGAFSFKWKDRSSLENGYQLESRTGTATFKVLGTLAANTSSTTPVTGFAFKTPYDFRVRAYRIVSSKKVYSAYSPIVTSTSTSLKAPTAVVATPVNDNSATVTWKDESARESGYEVEYRKIGETTYAKESTAANGQTRTLSQLEAGKVYEIRIRAFDVAGGKSSYSPVVQVKVRDGILGDLDPPIFWKTSFLYQIQVSQPAALTSLIVSSLPSGLSYDSSTLRIRGSVTVEGEKTVTLKATFNDGYVTTRKLVLRIIRPPTAPVAVSGFSPVELAAATTQKLSLTGKFRDPDTTSAARLITTLGVVDVILYPLATPKSVKNFLDYMDAGRYDHSFFHRSVAQGSLYIVQGGGYQNPSGSTFQRVASFAPLVNEPGISNLRGTLAMAKVGGQPDSATSEFFVNLNDVNAPNLDVQNSGFSVFGRLTEEGIKVFETINALSRKNYTISLSSGSKLLEDVPTTSTSTGSQLEPSHLVKITAAGPAPILRYQVSSDRPDLVSATLAGEEITLTAVAPGLAKVSVKVTDLDGMSISRTFDVRVP